MHVIGALCAQTSISPSRSSRSSRCPRLSRTWSAAGPASACSCSTKRASSASATSERAAPPGERLARSFALQSNALHTNNIPNTNSSHTNTRSMILWIFYSFKPHTKHPLSHNRHFIYSGCSYDTLFLKLDGDNLLIPEPKSMLLFTPVSHASPRRFLIPNSFHYRYSPEHDFVRVFIQLSISRVALHEYNMVFSGTFLSILLLYIRSETLWHSFPLLMVIEFPCAFPLAHWMSRYRHFYISFSFSMG